MKWWCKRWQLIGGGGGVHSGASGGCPDGGVGHIDHSARVMRVITWNKSIRGMHNADDKKDVFDAEEYETHATVLDKLLAWEKKLYDEVKAGELMKHEYQRKVALLNKQKKRSASTESLEKTKAAVSHLHTRYIVDMQSMDSTVSEVNHIRDDQLYPKLVALVDGMAKMWNDMCMQHNSQLKMVTDLKSIDISQAPKETSKHHHERTIQLWNEIQGWHSQFEKLVTHEKQYIQALNSWLKLNLIPIESSLKEKISSPPRPQHPPIQALLHSWHDSLEKLPHELAKSAISSFAAVIKTIILHQEEEMKLKEKTPPDETDPEKGDEANPKDPISEKQFVVESLKKKLEEEVEAHQRHCVQVREKSLGSLKLRLPELFRALIDYTHACSDAYQRLKAITSITKHEPRGGVQPRIEGQKSGHAYICWKWGSSSGRIIAPKASDWATGNSGSKWRLLWRKIKQENKKIFHNSTPPSRLASYDMDSYSQNFDQGPGGRILKTGSGPSPHASLFHPRFCKIMTLWIDVDT
ncbi:Nitrate regulatory gene2 protein [Vitis vinifera]|uniref:Nitrate regulatory gene2 protein n=1 Tax=Vitis vinifera TaxID=29760 RepID=A0A438KEV2_VITVI|nr:Nitrate regulatory gene2 protein [Vitis vinifera]